MQIPKRLFLFVISIMVLSLLLAACKPAGKDADAALATSVYETIVVGETRTAIARPSDTPVPTPTMIPTNPPVQPTPAQPTVDLTAVYGITQSPPPVATQPGVNPTVPGAVERGDWAKSSPPDGTLVDSGAKFKVVVTIVNNGTTTWSTDYYIQHVSGPSFGVTAKQMMPTAIPPSMSVSFEMEFTAPDEVGKLKSNWAIYNANNVIIGNFYFEYEVD